MSMKWHVHISLKVNHYQFGFIILASYSLHCYWGNSVLKQCFLLSSLTCRKYLAILCLSQHSIPHHFHEWYLLRAYPQNIIGWWICWPCLTYPHMHAYPFESFKVVLALQYVSTAIFKFYKTFYHYMSTPYLGCSSVINHSQSFIVFSDAKVVLSTNQLIALF